MVLSWKNDVAVRFPAQCLIQILLNSVRKLPLAAASTIANTLPSTPQQLVQAFVTILIVNKQSVGAEGQLNELLRMAELACIQTLTLAGEYPYLVISLQAILVSPHCTT